MPSDTTSPTPRRMPWEEFERRAVASVKALAQLRGANPGETLREELFALFGWQAQNVSGALKHPPAICSRCLRLHDGWDSVCYPCSKEQEHKARVDMLRAEIEAKVRAELAAAQKGEA